MSLDGSEFAMNVLQRCLQTARIKVGDKSPAVCTLLLKISILKEWPDYQKVKWDNDTITKLSTEHDNALYGL